MFHRGSVDDSGQQRCDGEFVEGASVGMGNIKAYGKPIGYTVKCECGKVWLLNAGQKVKCDCGKLIVIETAGREIEATS